MADNEPRFYVENWCRRPDWSHTGSPLFARHIFDDEHHRWMTYLQTKSGEIIRKWNIANTEQFLTNSFISTGGIWCVTIKHDENTFYLMTLDVINENFMDLDVIVGLTENIVYNPTTNNMIIQRESKFEEREVGEPILPIRRPALLYRGRYVGRDENMEPMFSEDDTRDVYYKGKIVGQAAIAQVGPWGMYVNDPEQGYLPLLNITPATFPQLSPKMRDTLRALLVMNRPGERKGKEITAFRAIPLGLWYYLASWVNAAERS